MDNLGAVLAIAILAVCIPIVHGCTHWLDGYLMRGAEAERQRQQREAAELHASIEAFLAERRR